MFVTSSAVPTPLRSSEVSVCCGVRGNVFEHLQRNKTNFFNDGENMFGRCLTYDWFNELLSGFIYTQKY